MANILARQARKIVCMLIGEIVRYLMEQQGLTQRTLAARVRASGAPNVKYQHIQQLIDIPTRSPRYLPALAKAFGLTVEQFLNVSDNGIAPPQVRDLTTSNGGRSSAPRSQSQSLQLDASTLATSYQLVRLACIALDEHFDPEQPGDAELVLLAYNYLTSRDERTVTANNVVDFTARLRKQTATKGGMDEGQRSTRRTSTGAG